MTNALMLRGALTTRSEPDVRVMTAVPVQSITEPFIRLRADRHLRHGPDRAIGRRHRPVRSSL
ncbi:hypothetical protein [Streptomyces lydicus]|uniref:hypothetical protein n=1 Tax=Streptomyces lydicus TaxID=47763 RepID=UPI000F8EC025|nr:hypothetical protein [Streptomyces lydicus]